MIYIDNIDYLFRSYSPLLVAYVNKKGVIHIAISIGRCNKEYDVSLINLIISLFTFKLIYIYLKVKVFKTILLAK